MLMVGNLMFNRGITENVKKPQVDLRVSMGQVIPSPYFECMGFNYQKGCIVIVLICVLYIIILIYIYSNTVI